MNATQWALMVAAFLVNILSLIIKKAGFGGEESAWVEGVVAFVMAVIATVVTGQAWTGVPVTDPVSFFQALWTNIQPVLVVALAVYLYFQQQIVESVRKARAERLAIEDNLPF
jgi:hypothetical protein